MIRRRSLLVALPLGAVACDTPPRWPVHGATDDGGIGGTGLRAGSGPEDGGIGGTGVFGAVTALGSLEVNGLRLETDAATVFETLGGGPVRQGDTVAAEVVQEGAWLRANRVAVFHPLIGPLAAGTGGGWSVLGTAVGIGPDTPIRVADGGVAGLAALRPDQAVAVSGLWQDDRVVATAITLIPAPPLVVLRGLLRRRDGALFIGGTRIDAASLPAAAPEERFVQLHGRPGPRGVVPATLSVRPLAVFGARVGALSVEGFLAPNRDIPGFHLAGFGLLLDPTSPIAPQPGTRQLMLGRYGDAFRVDDSLALPDGEAARRQALAVGAAPLNARWFARR